MKNEYLSLQKTFSFIDRLKLSTNFDEISLVYYFFNYFSLSLTPKIIQNNNQFSLNTHLH